MVATPPGTGSPQRPGAVRRLYRRDGGCGESSRTCRLRSVDHRHPPGVENHPEIRLLVMAADFILVPSQPSITDTTSVRKWMPYLSGYRRPAAFVLNAVDPRAKHALASAKMDLN